MTNILNLITSKTKEEKIKIIQQLLNCNKSEAVSLFGLIGHELTTENFLKSENIEEKVNNLISIFG